MMKSVELKSEPSILVHHKCHMRSQVQNSLRAATNESKGRHRRESKNKKQETKRFSTFAVYRLRHSETKKNIA